MLASEQGLHLDGSLVLAPCQLLALAALFVGLPALLGCSSTPPGTTNKGTDSLRETTVRPAATRARTHFFPRNALWIFVADASSWRARCKRSSRCFLSAAALRSAACRSFLTRNSSASLLRLVVALARPCRPRYRLCTFVAAALRSAWRCLNRLRSCLPRYMRCTCVEAALRAARWASRLGFTERRASWPRRAAWIFVAARVWRSVCRLLSASLSPSASACWSCDDDLLPMAANALRSRMERSSSAAAASASANARASACASSLSSFLDWTRARARSSARVACESASASSPRTRLRSVPASEMPSSSPKSAMPADPRLMGNVGDGEAWMPPWRSRRRDDPRLCSAGFTRAEPPVVVRKWVVVVTTTTPSGVVLAVTVVSSLPRFRLRLLP